MRTVIILLTLGVAIGSVRAEDHWPGFRGPNGDGTSSATGLPITWSESEHVAWKTAIHGKAWSSPVVWDDQIWLTTATEDGKQLSAVCVDRNTGRILRDLIVFQPVNPQYCHPENSYASPTPVIEAGRVYVHFGAHGTACLDTETGKIIWSRDDLECYHFRGPGSSPTLYENLLFLTFDGYDHQFVAALDKQTGKTVWRRDRDIDYGTENGDYKKAFSTPTVVVSGGRAQLVSPSAIATLAYDVQTGDVLWRVRHGGMNSAARPVFANGLLYWTTGSNGLLLAVRPGGRGDVSDSHVMWTSSRSVSQRPSPVVVGDLLFMVSDSGVVSCLDSTTGKPIWQRRLRGQFWASPLAAEGHIYLFNREGGTIVIEAGRRFKLLAENQLDDGFWASPAVAGRSLILRTKTHLYRVQELR